MPPRPPPGSVQLPAAAPPGGPSLLPTVLEVRQERSRKEFLKRRQPAASSEELRQGEEQPLLLAAPPGAVFHSPPPQQEGGGAAEQPQPSAPQRSASPPPGSPLPPGSVVPAPPQARGTAEAGALPPEVQYAVSLLPTPAIKCQGPPSGGDVIVVLCGQSNIQGRGTVDGMDRCPVPMAWMVDAAGRWHACAEPVHAVGPRGGGGCGPARALAAAMRPALSPASSARLLVVPCGAGSSYLSEWEPGGQLFGSAVARARYALQSCAAPGPRAVCLVWHQGEADSSDLGLAESYSRRFARLVVEWRRALRRTGTGNAKLPVVCGPLGHFLDQFVPIGGHFNPVHWRVVNSALQAAAKGISCVAAVPGAPLLASVSDNVHFDARSQRWLGGRYAEQLLQLIHQPEVDGQKWPLEEAAAKAAGDEERGVCKDFLRGACTKVRCRERHAEVRRAPDDGRWYPREDFICFYGGLGEWDAAEPTAKGAPPKPKPAAQAVPAPPQQGAPDKDLDEPLDFGVGPAAEAAHGPEEAEGAAAALRDRLCEVVASQTGLTPRYARLSLEAADWDAPRAVELCRTRRGVLPPEAFAQPGAPPQQPNKQQPQAPKPQAQQPPPQQPRKQQPAAGTKRPADSDEALLRRLEGSWARDGDKGACAVRDGHVEWPSGKRTRLEVREGAVHLNDYSLAPAAAAGEPDCLRWRKPDGSERQWTRCSPAAAAADARRRRRAALAARLRAWKEAFQKRTGRAASKKDVSGDPEMGSVYAEYLSLGQAKGGAHASA
eukprot:TRINITY_DN15057_c2_g1_i1.p1 TRINITY_DN15057_c2_g1~~TRINITY_DN15057_c2_g1_i1.p1  ORF type:complete len:796 (+),score=264.08 TRINITY_DN15057_c2_g1_i1:68-2389(+)